MGMRLSVHKPANPMIHPFMTEWKPEVFSNMETSLSGAHHREVLLGRSPGMEKSADDGLPPPSAQAEGDLRMPLNPDCRP